MQEKLAGYFALLLYAAARTEGLWQSLLRALAAWGALLMGQALCLALFVRLRPGRWGVGLALLGLGVMWGLAMAWGR